MASKTTTVQLPPREVQLQATFQRSTDLFHRALYHFELAERHNDGKQGPDAGLFALASLYKGLEQDPEWLDQLNANTADASMRVHDIAIQLSAFRVAMRKLHAHFRKLGGGVNQKASILLGDLLGWWAARDGQPVTLVDHCALGAAICIAAPGDKVLFNAFLSWLDLQDSSDPAKTTTGLSQEEVTDVTEKLMAASSIIQEQNDAIIAESAKFDVASHLRGDARVGLARLAVVAAKSSFIEQGDAVNLLHAVIELSADAGRQASPEISPTKTQRG